MLFFLRKLIEALLLPVGLIAFLVLIAVFLRRRWLAAVAAVLLYAFSIEPFANLLLQPLESTYPPVAVVAAPRADAIVVLSGGILRGRNRAGIQWDQSANRFFAGLDLAHADKANLLVISAGASPDQGPILRQAAVDTGISPACIALTPRVLTTADEADAVSRIPGIHSILLVTSAFHMPRAALLFRSRGFDVLPFPTDQHIFRHPNRMEAIALIPSPPNLEKSEAAFREYYGLLVYRTLLLLHH